jgi:putative DNA primase/helicase
MKDNKKAAPVGQLATASKSFSDRNFNAIKPPKPSPLPVILDNIPVELQELPCWVMWRYCWNSEKQKWIKPPHKLNSTFVDINKQNDLLKFEQVKSAYQAGGWDGIGIALNGAIAGGDLDHVIDSNGNLESWAAEVIEAVSDSYIERSPGGDGLRFFGYGKVLHNGKGGPDTR